MWPASDEALVAGLAAGDGRAATAFVRRFQARVYGLAVSMVGDVAVAEELAQEAFARAWRHAAAYDPRRGRVLTWLLSITRNLAIDHLRAKRTEPLDPGVLTGAERALWTSTPETPGGTVDAQTVSLREALAELPAEQRRAVLLASLYGYTAREIAEIEDVPLGTAKTRIRTALHKLAADPAAADEPRGGGA